MSTPKIIFVFLLFVFISCRTDKVESEYYYQILNNIDTTITVKFNRGGVDRKTLAIGVNDTVLACQGSGFEGDIPTVYDCVFMYYKNNVFIDSLKDENNSLLNTDNYFEYKKVTIKGVDHVYNIFTVDSNYINAKSN